MKNRELQKNIWLEITPARLLTSPIVLGLFFLLLHSVTDDMKKEWYEIFSSASLVIMGFMLVIWGNKQAADALTSEYNDRTWLSQKMTPLSAGEMTTGKLFGSTIYIWYNVAILTAVYLISVIASGEIYDGVLRLLLLFTGSILGHAVAMMLSLQAMKNNRYAKKLKRNGGFALGVIVSYSTVMAMKGFGDSGMNWFTIEQTMVESLLFRNVVLLFWALVGLYRMMRRELQFDSYPVALPLFVFTMGIYVAGANPVWTEAVSNPLLIVLYSIYGMAMVSFVFSALNDTIDPVALRKLGNRWNSGDMAGAFTQVPLWLTALTSATVITAILTLYSAVTPSLSIDALGGEISRKSVVTLLPLTIYFFVIRDLVVLIIIKGIIRKWAEFFSAIYLVTIYGIIPGIFLAGGAEEVCHLFWPFPADNIYLMTLPVLVEAAAVLALLLFKKEKLLGFRSEK